MKKVILVIAPHPDDESLGCGGTLLKAIQAGAEVHWLIMTSMDAPGSGYAPEAASARRAEIAQVAQAFGFAQTHVLQFTPSGLDQRAGAERVKAIAQIIEKVLPTDLYLPFPGDAHSDHAATFQSAIAACKWFRAGSIERVLCYETLSETDQGAGFEVFRPQVYVDISAQLEAKLRILKIYQSELGKFPFPRSETAVRALAQLRGSYSGFEAAESFQLIRERLS